MPGGLAAISRRTVEKDCNQIPQVSRHTEAATASSKNQGLEFRDARLRRLGGSRRLRLRLRVLTFRRFSRVSSKEKQGKLGIMNYSLHIQALLSGWLGHSLVESLPALACTYAASSSSTVAAFHSREAWHLIFSALVLSADLATVAVLFLELNSILNLRHNFEQHAKLAWSLGSCTSKYQPQQLRKRF